MVVRHSSKLATSRTPWIILFVMVGLLLAGSVGTAHAAHCFCRATLKLHQTTNPSDFTPLANVDGLAEGQFTIPGWDKNQTVDAAKSSAGASGSCWWECRHAFGVDNNGQVSAEAAALKAYLVNQAVAKGAPSNWCGGWLSASLKYAAGTNSYKEATGAYIGLNARSCGTCQCIQGGSAAGPNCWIPSNCKNPEVIPGIAYWVDTNPQWPGVYYQQIDSKCPYGGTPAGPNCQLRSFPANFVKPGVSYWVDTDPKWPGVYYHQVTGLCPYGGSPGGPNCHLTSFSLPACYFVKGVSYWIDANPQWPGVYYSQIQGQCPYGGGIAGPNCHIFGFPASVVKPGVSYWVDADPRWPGVYYAKVCQ